MTEPERKQVAQFEGNAPAALRELAVALASASEVLLTTADVVESREDRDVPLDSVVSACGMTIAFVVRLANPHLGDVRIKVEAGDTLVAELFAATDEPAAPGGEPSPR